MSRLATLSTLALLLLAACGRDLELEGEPKRKDPATTTIAGRVVASLPGVALPTEVAGASLRIVTPEGVTRVEGTTGADGRFLLVPGLTPWELRVSADLDGDGTADAQLRVTSDELPLIEGTDASLGDLLVRQAVQLSGTVRRGDLPQLDRGHAAILVEVPGVPFAVTRTSDAGQFVLERLPVGPTLLRLSAPGYFEEELSLDLPSGAEVTLADVSLVPVAPVDPGAITGTVLREDGGDGEVTIEALRAEDGLSLARLVGALGVPWTLDRLPPATYDVRIVVAGYGTATVPGVVVRSLETADAGAVVLRPDTVVVRDGAVATWTPPGTQVLPSLGAIRAALDVSLDPSSFPRGAVSARLLRIEDADGHEVVGDQLYVEAGEALPDGTIASGPTIWFSPRRPLAPGRYVGSLPATLRDRNNRVVQSSEVAWTSVGPALLHVVDGGGLLPPSASVGELRLGRRADGRTHLLYLQHAESGSSAHYCAFDAGGGRSCREVFAPLAGTASSLTDLDVASFPGGELFVARQLGAAARACPPGPVGSPGVLTVELPDGSIRLLEDPAGDVRHCARSLATLPDGSGALYADWSPGGAELLVRNDPFFDPETGAPLGYRPDPAVVQASPPASLSAVPVGTDSVLVAWDGPANEAGHRLFRLGRAGGLEQLPALPLPTRTAAEIPSLCELDGQPMALLVRSGFQGEGPGGFGGFGGAGQGGFGGSGLGGFGGIINPGPSGGGGLGGAGGGGAVERASVEALRLDPTTGAWVPMPALVPAGAGVFLGPARCARVGKVTFALSVVDGQVRLAWWSGARWEPIHDAEAPEGSIGGVPAGAGCSVPQAALLGGADGVDVAWVESCFRSNGDGFSLSETIRLRKVR